MKLNPTIKRYLISSAITFGANFLIAFATFFALLDERAVESISMSVIWAAVNVAARAGLKALVEPSGYVKELPNQTKQ